MVAQEQNQRRRERSEVQIRRKNHARSLTGAWRRLEAKSTARIRQLQPLLCTPRCTNQRRCQEFCSPLRCVPSGTEMSPPVKTCEPLQCPDIRIHLGTEYNMILLVHVHAICQKTETIDVLEKGLDYRLNTYTVWRSPEELRAIYRGVSLR